LQPLGRALGVDQPLYAFQAIGLDGKTPPLSSVEDTAKVNLAALKRVQGQGPYRFIGHSYGGVVAYEMTRILLEQGEEVASLVLLDSRAPSAMERHWKEDEALEVLEGFMATARLYDLTVDIDLERLRQLPADERVGHVIGLLAPNNGELDGEQIRAFYEVYRANMGCYRAYRPRRLPRGVDASLYRATVRMPGEHVPVGDVPADYGWNELLPGAIRVYDVDADHFSILKKVVLDSVAETAAALAAP
jgi:thioesterase domain-containing protein